MEAYVQDPASGHLFPIEREAEFPAGNIQIDGQLYSHAMGMQVYQQGQQGAAAPQEPPGIHQITTAPDGVPYYQSSDGKYWTKNADGSYTQQTIDPASWATKPPGDSTGTGGAPPPGPGTGLISGWNGQAPPGQTPFAPPAAGAMPGAPSFTAPAYKPPPAFEKPTLDEAMNDPGYQFSQREGQRALENSAAARGLLYSGGTLKDIAQWNQGLAETQYNNVFNRDLSTYQQNYQTQYQDPYQIQYKGALDTFNPQQQQWMTNMQAQQRSNEFNYMNAYDQYKFNYQQWLDRLNFSKGLAES